LANIQEFNTALFPSRNCIIVHSFEMETSFTRGWK